MPARESHASTTGRLSRNSGQPFDYEEGSLDKRAPGAPTLAYQLSLPEEPKAAVLIVHGYGEHGGRYRRVVERWGGAKIACAVVDLRGHGWSEGARGHCERFGEYHDDVADMLTVVHESLSGVPLFAFGHSFGALVLATYAIEHPDAFRGLVLSSPYFGLALKVPKWKTRLGEFASRMWPRLSLSTGLSGHDLTHDETIARLYDNDPLVNKQATARWFTETETAQAGLLTHAAHLTLPILIIQGGADRVASASTARAVFNLLTSPDKTFDERAGLFHEVLNEPHTGDQIAGQMSDWILAHTPQP